MSLVSKAQTQVKNGLARASVALMLLASGEMALAAGEFTDRIQSAKAIDTKQLRENAKSGADNIAFIVSVGAMVIGLVIMLWGILWVSSAARSEGRKNATAGWIMVVCGGALGAGVPLFMWLVGAFNGASN